MFSAEFSQHWPSDEATPASTAPAERDDVSLSPSQREALEELVDRVTAARSVL
ncbi:MAG: hypothetical protein ABI920_05285 [Casimicrobiaceae bacterium]